jgi:hypothetical protein
MECMNDLLGFPSILAHFSSTITWTLPGLIDSGSLETDDFKTSENSPFVGMIATGALPYHLYNTSTRVSFPSLTSICET